MTDCTCTTIVELRQPEEIDAEIDGLFGLLELRLKKAGYPEIAPSVANMRRSWRDWSGFSPTEPSASPCLNALVESTAPAVAAAEA